MGQIVPINVACSVYNNIANCYIPLLFDEGVGDSEKNYFEFYIASHSCIPSQTTLVQINNPDAHELKLENG